ncbi:MAG: hypothetical protein JNL70_06580 [Saprospiraceae bacterium]|nr:hypothetical protein [Saprospiraceae bacterium]
MNKSLHILWVLLLATSCKTENERQIVGKWQAAQLMECDNVVPIQTDLVDIEFFSNGKYVFHSTLNVKEEGTYRIRKNYLFTQDKLRDKAPEKAVLIQSINDDSLVLQMSYKGKDQWLTLVREGVFEKNKQKEEEDAQAKALAITAGSVATIAAATTTNSDSAQKAEEVKKAEEEKKKAEAAAEKKREEEADRKREAEKKKESSSSTYKEREAKRKAEERKAKEEAEKKAEKFRREYAKREAERKKKEAAARKKK